MQFFVFHVFYCFDIPQKVSSPYHFQKIQSLLVKKPEPKRPAVHLLSLFYFFLLSIGLEDCSAPMVVFISNLFLLI
jgi:hypothetical protein